MNGRLQIRARRQPLETIKASREGRRGIALRLLHEANQRVGNRTDLDHRRVTRVAGTGTGTGTGAEGAEIPIVTAVRRVVDGNPTRIVTDSVELDVIRIVDGSVFPAGATLTGTWTGQPGPALLAYLR
jgi:hypothetical protein